MKGRRQARGGFTLTEVLMAVGILGIGLTMVTAVFPVAINESRRGDEATHAALCARSVAAMLRMRRSEVIKFGHSQVTTAPKILSVPAIFNVYAPGEFLYDNNRSYTGMAQWNAGRYTTHLLIAPHEANKGPWRITILVYKARGTLAAYGAWHSSTPPAMPGEYIVDPSAVRGEAYMIDYIDNKGTSGLSDDLLFTASGRLHTPPDPANPSQIPVAWIGFAGAVAAYHTIVGD